MRDGQGAGTVQDTVPDHVVQLVYGRLGFSAEHSAILTYRQPYVLLVTASRSRDPYSIVSLDTGRTVERFADTETATGRLDGLVGDRP